MGGGNGVTKAPSYYYDEESNAINSLIQEASTIDGIRIIVVILFIVFECVPVIMGSYILSNHYSLYFIGMFATSLFGVYMAKEKFHYVLIIVFSYSAYIFMLFAIAFDSFEQRNASLYHIKKLQTFSILWILIQFIIAAAVYKNCCQPGQIDNDNYITQEVSADDVGF